MREVLNAGEHVTCAAHVEHVTATHVEHFASAARRIEGGERELAESVLVVELAEGQVGVPRVLLEQLYKYELNDKYKYKYK